MRDVHPFGPKPRGTVPTPSGYTAPVAVLVDGVLLAKAEGAPWPPEAPCRMLRDLVEDPLVVLDLGDAIGGRIAFQPGNGTGLLLLLRVLQGGPTVAAVTMRHP